MQSDFSGLIGKTVRGIPSDETTLQVQGEVLGVIGAKADDRNTKGTLIVKEDTTNNLRFIPMGYEKQVVHVVSPHEQRK